MSTTTNADTELLDPWQRGTRGEGGPPPPPPPSGGGGDPDGLMVPSFMEEAHPPGQETVAARGEVMSHWADDVDGTPLNAEKTIGDLEAKIPSGGDKGDGLAALETASAQKKQEVQKQAEVEEVKLEEHGDKAKEEAKQEVKDSHPTATDIKEGKPHDHPAGKHKLAAPKPSAPVTKDGLIAKVNTTAAKEIEELDQSFGKQKEHLEERFSSQLGSLDAEQKKQEARVAGHVGAGDSQMDAAIQHHQDAHNRQIAGEQKKIDAEVTKQSKPVEKQGADDAEKPIAEAKLQAQQTRENGQKRAEEVRGRTRTEAVNARAMGKSSGDEAQKAAEAQAAKAAEGEKATVIAEGTKRRMMALNEAEVRAKAIESKGDAEAQKIIQLAETDAQTQMQRGEQAAAQARTNAKSGTAQIQGEADKGHASMQAISNDAVGKMKGAQGEADDKSKEQSGKSSEAMTGAQQDAKIAADKEKTEALAKLQATHDAQVKKIEDKAQAELAKIEKAKDSDLSHLEKQVNGDLKAMEKMAEDADKRMNAQVKQAEQRLAVKVRQQKQKMRAEAVKAMCAIDKFVAEARKKIRQADKGVHHAIADAGKAGKQAVTDMGPQALASVTEANQKDLEGTIKAAEADRKKLDEGAAKVETDLTKDAEAVEGAIKDKMVKDALASVKGDLTREHWYSYVSDDEATRAMNALASLPKGARGEAMKDLPKEQFDNLLSEVPKARKEDFKALVDDTHDPKRKLLLWGEYQKTHADAEADRAEDKDTGHWWSRTREQKANKARNDHRSAAASETANEVDDEVKFLMEKEKKGTLTEKDVEDLEKRKAKELELEMKFGVNLTNERGTRKTDAADPNRYDGSKIVWSETELGELEKTLNLIPRDNMGGNENMKVIRREDEDSRGTGVGASHSDGVIRLFDTGSSEKGGPNANHNFRVNGDPRQGPVMCSICGALITRMDAVLIHELGHNVHDSNSEAFEKYQKAAGWKKDLGDGDLKKAGISEADIQKMKDTRDAKNADGTPKNSYEGQYRVKGADGKMYMIDPYTSKFLAVDADATPVDAGGFAHGQWGYAQSNQKDAFAEHYQMALTKPDDVYNDLVGGPKTQVDSLTTTLGTLPPGPARDAIQQQLDAAKATQTKRQAEYDVMRNDVLHTDAKQAELVKELKAKGIDTSSFEADAAKLSTPEQVEKRANRYKLGTNSKQAELAGQLKAKGVDTTAFEKEAERLETPQEVAEAAKKYGGP